MKLPVAENFINASKLPNKVKRMCMQMLLDRAKHLMELKPNDKEKYRVVVLVNLSSLWDSEIIVFKGNTYFTL